MKTLKFEIDIAAEPKKVWNTMLNADTYKKWVSAAWPDSFYKGEFKKGNEVSFIGPDGSGMLAQITDFNPSDQVKMKHIAILNPGGVRDTSSDMAKTLVGTEENYFFKKSGDNTHLVVELKVNPSWEQMFSDTWPTALKDLKSLSEQ